MLHDSLVTATECIMWQRGYRWLFRFLRGGIHGVRSTTNHAVPRIDGSTPEAFQASWDRLHHSLTGQQQSQLDLRCFHRVGKYGSLTAVRRLSLPRASDPKRFAPIDGLSFQEIIDLANRQPYKISR